MKIVLVDGNNLLFRSYYATAYKGNFMKNSKGFPTNALYGFLNMLNRIIQDMNPTHIMVAFDIGKTFRHEKYKDYKGGRSETPLELKEQFPLAKKLVEAMGIKHIEIENFEADDIIGTFSEYITNHDDLTGIIVSSDKDLIQLINDKVTMKLLKINDFIMMDKNIFKEMYELDDPIRMIDLKSLMGDSSDNIPGVLGIGEKTAISLLKENKTLDGVYQNIDKLSPSIQKKLNNSKEQAYLSYDLATIYKHVPININLDDVLYKGINIDKYKNLLNELEFFSILKKLEIEDFKNQDINYKIITNLSDLNPIEPYAIYLETLGYNYHTDYPLGVSIKDINNSYYIPFDVLKDSKIFLDNKVKYTYDLKKLLYVFDLYNIKIDNKIDDLMLICYLLNKNIKNDIAHLANTYSYNIRFYEKIYGSERTIKLPESDDYIKDIVLKSYFIFDKFSELYKELESLELIKLYKEIELPLTYVLKKMEMNGFLVDQNYFLSFKKEINQKLLDIENKIYSLASEEFNISSTRKVGEILFDKLKIPYPKKNTSTYSTSKDILDKLKDDYEIVNLILEYRKISKINSNYIVSLLNEVESDSKIHTIYNQTLTRTGRLSSERPNLQNIPIREDFAKLIRKGFIKEGNNKIASFDYSQIELRVFASMSNATDMIEAFNKGIDIHTKTASEVFKVAIDKVTSDMRRKAKAVNFGILYGISSFGLSADLGIDIKEAKEFIDTYLETFPSILEYQKKTIEEARKNGYVKTLMNRIRIVDEINNKNFLIRQGGERMALNAPIQGTAADIMKLAMVKINEKMEELKLKSKMLVQVHDELVFEVFPEEEDILKNMVIDIMKNVYKLKVPLDVSYEIGENWYDAK